MMAKVTGSHLIGKALKLEGVTNVFTLAGDHILPALDVMTDQDFRFIDTRHEQAAVHMADAWGRITGQLGVCMYTTPGFANAIPGLTNALHSESPLLSIAGSADLSDLGRGAMQEINQVGMAAPITKESLLVHEARRIPDMIARAVRLAFSGRRGPVHLTIPVDVQEQEVDEDEVAFYNPDEYRPGEAVLAPAELVRRAVALMREARRPFAIAGDAAGYALSGEALQKFAETARIPVLTEGQARGLIADDHPYGFGFFERGLNRAAAKLRDADLVILLGRKQDYTIGFCRPPNVAADARIIQIDPSAAEIGRNRGVAVGMVGDVTSVLEQLTQEAAAHTWQDLPWLDELRATRAAQSEWAEGLAIAETPMHAMYVHKTLESMLRPDDVLCFDGGDFCHFGRALLPAQMPRHWFYVSTLGMLGSSLPTALAAKVAYPDSRVINLSGDGAFGFNGMEFDTAVRHNLNVVTVLGNDSAWGIDRQIQLGLYGRPVATDLLQTRYDQVAQGLGGYGEFVERPEDLRLAIERALASNKPSLVNVVVQRAISPRAEAAITRRQAISKR
jgi:acetolactate synthase-1/2/3 large subunit